MVSIHFIIHSIAFSRINFTFFDTSCNKWDLAASHPCNQPENRLNASAYNRIVDELSDSLYRFAWSMLKDEDESKDVVQDAFVKLWERRDQVNPEKVKSYLFTTAHHKIIDQFRKAKRQQSLDQTEVKMSVVSQTPDLNEVLQEALNTLPEIQRSVILLRDYEGYNYEEIAEMTQLNLSQVKVYIFRGRKKLKDYIGSIEAVLWAT